MNNTDYPNAACADTAIAPRDNTLLGNVLAIGARLVNENRIPQDVIDGEAGAFALCLAMRDAVDVRVLHAGDKVEVGRSPSGANSSWMVDDPWMSRRHFCLAVDAKGAPSLCCLGAKNGTFVNDAAVEGGTTLRRGDVIRAGSSSFLLL